MLTHDCQLLRLSLAVVILNYGAEQAMAISSNVASKLLVFLFTHLQHDAT
jgi:hypothetical protein